MKKLFLILCAAVAVFTVQAQQIDKNGGLTMQQISSLRGSYQSNPANKALRNAINSNDISKLAVNYDNNTAFDPHLSNTVPSKAISNQESSGRCWMFTGMNVLRNKAIRKHDLPADFQFSQCYTFFWDQLEKANLFLQAILDNRAKSMEDETVQWLFKNPIGDGGQFTGVANLISKYGVVPKDAMPETYNSNHTSRISELIKLKLREDGLVLREMANNKGTTEQKLQATKMAMLETIYRMLAYAFGEPPTEFTWTQRNSKGEANMAIASIKDSTMMYFSCDVAKFLDRDRGYMDVNNYDYGALFGTTFGMDKKQRVSTFASGSSHAMTLCGVDLDTNGKPTKWMVENSWGSNRGHDGFLIMTNEWFNEYMFRLVVESKYIPAATLKLFDQKPIMLPAWDPLFAPEE